MDIADFVHYSPDINVFTYHYENNFSHVSSHTTLTKDFLSIEDHNSMSHLHDTALVHGTKKAQWSHMKTLHISCDQNNLDIYLSD